MPLVFREAHAAPDKKKINEEWFILENTSAAAINTRGLQVVSGHVNKGQRGSFLGTIDPGFMLQPGEKILVEPGGFLYKDSSVQMNTVQQRFKTGMLGTHTMYLAEMTGPGRVRSSRPDTWYECRACRS